MGLNKTVEQQAKTSVNDHHTKGGKVLIDNRPVQRKNNTGLPNNLKSGIENLSGHSMDDVKVHYNSSKPAQLNAHAYAQGTDIHLASGQEKHLPHEAWHVVQQKQGRVKPTMQLKGKVNVNDDAGLENEADVMGTKALQMKITRPNVLSSQSTFCNPIVQRKVIVSNEPVVSPQQGVGFWKGHFIPVNARAQGWIGDRWGRYYTGMPQFTRHYEGKPVDVGLAKGLGRWYNIPYFSQHQFFVLGENHGVFGYRELVRESNQPGRVLGESGANPILHATPGSALTPNTQAAALKDDIGNSREDTMENVAGKVYYSLVSKKRQLRREQQNAAPPVAPQTAPEDDFLRNYQQAAPADRGEHATSGKPYFRDHIGTETFGDFNTTAGQYQGGQVATGVVNKLQQEVAHALPQNQALQTLHDAFTAFDTALNAQPKVWADVFTRIDALTAQVRALAEREFEQMLGGTRPQQIQTWRARKARVVANQVGNNADKHRAMTHRDTAMLQSIIKAYNSHNYIMAGLGNNHALNIAPDLPAHIPLITFQQFRSNHYSQNALDPAAVVPNLLQKEITANQAAQGSMQVSRLAPQQQGQLVPQIGAGSGVALSNIQMDLNFLSQTSGMSIPFALNAGMSIENIFTNNWGEIRTMYKRASLKAHPDKNDGKDEDFKRITMILELFKKLKSGELVTKGSQRLLTDHTDGKK